MTPLSPTSTTSGPADLEGVRLPTLAVFDKVQVQTRNTHYEIFLLDPEKGLGLVRGGRFFPEPTKATISGSTFGGCLLKLGWIGVGMRMEILVNGHRVVTSPVQSYRVEPEGEEGAEEDTPSEPDRGR